MDFKNLFLQRYNLLYDFWMAEFWRLVPEDLMRMRPHEKVNSIAWIIWHMTRAEDAGMNRFVADTLQVMGTGGWMQKMNLPWRDLGSEMTLDEVDELSRLIDIQALHAYSDAVHARSQEIIDRIDRVDLDYVVPDEHVRKVVIDEGLAHSHPEELIRNYSGRSRGRWLFSLGLTHQFQHIGEIGVIGGMLGVITD